jgi:hypothetical protein
MWRKVHALISTACIKADSLGPGQYIEHRLDRLFASRDDNKTACHSDLAGYSIV